MTMHSIKPHRTYKTEAAMRRHLIVPRHCYFAAMLSSEPQIIWFETKVDPLGVEQAPKGHYRLLRWNWGTQNHLTYLGGTRKC
jgi:hypothetical protein